MKNLRANDSLIAFLLNMADNALILGHRNSEWTGHGPILEQDIAISNIALDLIGQSRNLYQYAAQLINNDSKDVSDFDGALGGISEDSLAYSRDGWDFKNCLLVEQTNGDWAKTILRQFLFSNYQFLLYEALKSSKDSQIAAISEKSLKEVTYHLRWSSEWVIRLGDGTAESHRRMLIALDDLWTYTGELFEPADYEIATALSGSGTDITLLRNRWEINTAKIFEQATLPKPSPLTLSHGMKNGKDGRHTEHLGYILTEMQFLQRAYPGCEW
jgi:ring-1,2-phenylacetyl-CoA epoxidase subunit PaaC